MEYPYPNPYPNPKLAPRRLRHWAFLGQIANTPHGVIWVTGVCFLAFRQGHTRSLNPGNEGSQKCRCIAAWAKLAPRRLRHWAFLGQIPKSCRALTHMEHKESQCELVSPERMSSP